MTASPAGLAQLVTSLRLQATLLDALGEAVIATELDGRILYWNRFAEQLYGWRADEVLGRNIVDVTPGSTSKEQAAELLRRLSRGESWCGEFLVRKRDGMLFRAQVTDRPVLDEDGNLVAIVGVSTDVSERERARVAERVLARASAELAESLNARAALQGIARMAISRDLARRMGGDVAVRSAVGVGSTFTLVLPRARVRATGRRPPPRSPTPGNAVAARRVLVPPAAEVAAIVRRVCLRLRRRGPYPMGMHALPTTGWTVDMLETLPDDGKRYEIIDGELFVTPAPYLVHQIIASELHARLREYLRAHPVGRAIVAPADVRVGDRTSVEPDVFVIPQVKGPFPRAWAPLGSLLLAVEVLWGSTARVDRGRKRLLYQREGVPEYWIVDVDSQVVERWRPRDERPEILTERLEWRPSGLVEPLGIDLAELFAEVE